MAHTRTSGKPNTTDNKILAGIDLINQRLSSLELQMSTKPQNLGNQLDLVTERIQQIAAQTQDPITITISHNGQVEQHVIQPLATNRSSQDLTAEQMHDLNSGPSILELNGEEPDFEDAESFYEDENLEGTQTKPTAARKTRSKKDPNAPKRNLSSYMFFCQANREQIKKENPNANFGQMGKLLGERWKSLTEEEKKPYIIQAEADSKRYQNEKALWKGE